MQHSCVLTGKNKRNANQNVAIGYMGTVGQQSKDSIVRDFRNRTDDMLGKTVKLIKGQYKGHLGIVVEATETHVKVEMSTKHKILTVESIEKHELSVFCQTTDHSVVVSADVRDLQQQRSADPMP
eukprot:8921-Heterococcus_DN1.PRE.1